MWKMCFLFLFSVARAQSPGEGAPANSETVDVPSSAHYKKILVLGKKQESSLLDTVPTVTTLEGDDLVKERTTSLGETLSKQAGVNASSYGPTASRPIIRGLDGDRIRVLQNGIGVLDAAAARGVLPLALHPVMTFVGRAEDLDRLDGAMFGVTADEALRPVAESLVVEMGGEPVWVPEAARPLYHAALSIGSNHLVTLVADALALLDGAGVERPDQLLAPLVSASLDNVLRLRDAALTGPVSRGDTATVVTHLRTLQAEAPDVLASYREMALRTAQRAHAAGRLDDERFAAVVAVLEERA